MQKLISLLHVTWCSRTVNLQQTVSGDTKSKLQLPCLLTIAPPGVSHFKRLCVCGAADVRISFYMSRSVRDADVCPCSHNQGVRWLLLLPAVSCRWRRHRRLSRLCRRGTRCGGRSRWRRVHEDFIRDSETDLFPLVHVEVMSPLIGLVLPKPNLLCFITDDEAKEAQPEVPEVPFIFGGVGGVFPKNTRCRCWTGCKAHWGKLVLDWIHDCWGEFS